MSKIKRTNHKLKKRTRKIMVGAAAAVQEIYNSGIALGPSPVTNSELCSVKIEYISQLKNEISELKKKIYALNGENRVLDEKNRVLDEEISDLRATDTYLGNEIKLLKKENLLLAERNNNLKNSARETVKKNVELKAKLKENAELKAKLKEENAKPENEDARPTIPPTTLTTAAPPLAAIENAAHRKGLSKKNLNKLPDPLW